MKINKSKKEKSEKEIQNEILEYLTKGGYLCWRNNNVGLYDVRLGTFRRKGKYQMLGVSDIFLIVGDGRFVAIEVKSKKGKISEYQQNFIDLINQNGGIAFVARNIEDVEKNLFLL